MPDLMNECLRTVNDIRVLFAFVCFRLRKQTFFNAQEECMLQIKNLTLTHKYDLRVILKDFHLVLNPGDKAVIIGEEGNGKSTLLK